MLYWWVVTMTCLAVEPVTAQDWIQQAGDVLQFILPAAAGASTIVQQDWEGTRQFALSLGTSWLVTTGMKEAFGKHRPDGGASDSWPSGHTMSAFAGASFLYTRYGRVVGIPAYVLAGFTGYSRLLAEKHFADDILAGASISLLSNWYYVTPASDRVQVGVLPAQDGGRLALTYRLGSSTGSADNDPGAHQSSHGSVRYRFVFGPAYLRGERGTAVVAENQLTLRDFQKTNNPTTTSEVQVTWQIDGNHQVATSLWPFEVRDRAYLADSTVFGGTLLPAGSGIDVSDRLYDFRISYRYSLVANEWVKLRVGSDLSLRWSSVNFSDTTHQLKEGDSDFVLLPLPGIHVTFRITPLIRPELYMTGIYFSDISLLEAGGDIRLSFDPHWDGTIGYQFYGQSKKEVGAILQHAKYDMLFMAIAHTF